MVVELDLEDDGQQLSERVRLTLYRISQHILSNVAQHAQATHVFISLKLKDDQVELCIRDNGCGFEMPDDWLTMIQQGKFGLLNCMERAEAIGGHLFIHSHPGKGTALQIIAPMTTHKPAAAMQDAAQAQSASSTPPSASPPPRPPPRTRRTRRNDR